MADNRHNENLNISSVEQIIEDTVITEKRDKKYYICNTLKGFNLNQTIFLFATKSICDWKYIDIFQSCKNNNC